VRENLTKDALREKNICRKDQASPYTSTGYTTKVMGKIHGQA